MKNANTLDWLQFDTATLPANLMASLDAYREAEATAAALKRDFHNAFVAEATKSGLGAPSGTEIILSFRFGNVSMAYKPIAAKTTSSKPTVGFNTPTKPSRRLTPRKG